MNKQAILKAKLTKLSKNIEKAVLVGSAKTYNEQIHKYFQEHPRGIGVTLQHFNPLKIDGSLSQSIIAVFNSPIPAIIALGPKGNKSGYMYPYDADNGTFVSFDEQPNLLKWATQNNIKIKGKKGLRVGKGATTRFGTASNQWHTIAGGWMKRSSTTRSNIINELKKIKV